jgi:glycosyltransferase involved in cell wall biosynthesis
MRFGDNENSTPARGSSDSGEVIVHVIDDLLPESGGPTTVVVELTRQQALAGMKVGVVCRRAPAGGVESPSLRAAWAGLDIAFEELRPQSSWSVRKRLLASTLARWQPRVLHLHCMWERLVRETAIIARRNQVPWVLSTHGMMHPQAIGRGWLKKYAYLWLLGPHFAGAREVLTLNQEETDFLIRRFHSYSSVLPNGIDVSQYKCSSDRHFRQQFPHLAETRNILFMGRLNPIKGIDLLIDAFAFGVAQGIPHQLLIVGPDGGMESKLRQQVAAKGLQNRVHFLGPLFGEAKLSAFRSCEIFAHRPRFEGFGLTIVEAMASEKPVVTTRACKLDSAAEAGALIMAEDTDIGFAQALVELAGDAALRRSVATRAVQWASEKYDWPSVAEQASRAYERACAQASA